MSHLNTDITLILESYFLTSFFKKKKFYCWIFWVKTGNVGVNLKAAASGSARLISKQYTTDKNGEKNNLNEACGSNIFIVWQ